MIKVSIIVAVYNAEKYLERCMKSLLAQTLREIEIICVNDGSTDSSLEILEKYVEQDKRLHILSMPRNSGAAAARNCGIDIAQGKYVQIVDADDALESNALEMLFAKAEKSQCDMCFFKLQLHNQEGAKESPGIVGEYAEIYTGKELLGIFATNKEFFLYPWSVLFRREFLNTNSLRYKSLAIGEGGDMNSRALYLANRVIVDNGHYYHYYINNESITHSTDSKFYSLIGQVYQYVTMFKLLADDECSEELEKYVERLRIKVSGGINNLSQEQYEVVKNKMMDSFSRQVLQSIRTQNNYLYDFTQEQIRRITQASCIMVFGAGYASSDVLRLLNQYGVEIKGFVVSKSMGNPYSLFGHHVYEISEIADLDKGILIIIAANKKYHSEINKELSTYGFYNLLYLDIII